MHIKVGSVGDGFAVRGTKLKEEKKWEKCTRQESERETRLLLVTPANKKKRKRMKSSGSRGGKENYYYRCENVEKQHTKHWRKKAFGGMSGWGRSASSFSFFSASLFS